jgi:hypothetical protein
VDAGEIMTISLGTATPSATAIVTPLDREPTMACTPSTLIRRVAASTATWGLVPESALMSSTSWPRTPPAALICLIASWAPVSMFGPNSASDPV